MRIAVCDDEDVYIDAIVEAIDIWRKRRQVSSVAIQTFCSSEDLLGMIESKDWFDIIFLDIQIPDEINGLEAARRIRSFDKFAKIVFVTNYAEHVYDGYYVNALRYLCKPVFPEQVFECMDVAYTQWKLNQDTDIMLRSKNSNKKLSYTDILYLESRGHNLMFYLTDTKEPIAIRMTLERVFDVLPSELFVRCHRSFIVNISYVRRITRVSLTMSDDRVLAIGK